MSAKPGDYVKIVEMKGEPRYRGKVGKVEFIDSIGQIHGDWGGCAIIPEADRYVVLPEERKPLFEMSEKTQTSRDGINMLADYYVQSLGWSEREAAEYAIGLFANGTIDAIKFIGKDGEEI